MDPLLLVNQCYDRLPSSMKTKPWEVTEHGRKVLQTEDELNAYIAAYGEMHIVKCRAALQNFPFEELEMYSYEIYDWGCGQGLASLTILDMLRERQKLSHLKRIFLIEPSSSALKRARDWVSQSAGPGIEIIAVNKFIPDTDNVDLPEVTCSSSKSINLFSNILDIRSLSLSWLAKKTANLANTNFMVCIGPEFLLNTNTRVKDFCGYFNPSEYFSDINAFPYSYTTRTRHAFGCEVKCFVHKKTKSLDFSYQECADKEYEQDPYDYSIDVLNGVVSDRVLEFYNKLRQACGSLFDIYFRPAINCDTADVVIASKSRGILILGVCEDLDEFQEAYNKIENVKSNLFNLHLKSLKVDSVTNPSIYYCIQLGLFFPNNSKQEIDDDIERRKINKPKSFNHLHAFTLSTNLEYELGQIYARGFRTIYYEELTNLISASWHSYRLGDLNFHLSNRQRDIVRSENKRIRVKGVAGCGKTQVVANKAVEQHLKTGDRVLIITFNISLIQYIRMRIGQVPADFSPNMFEITNYHQFFKSKASQYCCSRVNLDDFDNPHFFDPFNKQIKKYKTIIIDEVQDFKESWLQSIILNFLSEGGSVSLFGDGEQNIYDREQEKDTKMPPVRGCGFLGRWNEMNESMSERLSMRIQNPKIAALCSRFACLFLDNKPPLSIQNSFIFEQFYVKYWRIDEYTNADTLAGNIQWIISEHSLIPKDVIVMGQSINLLRDIEFAYKKASNLPTMINFETMEQYEDVRCRNENKPTYIQKDLDDIRRSAKTHFTTDCEMIKFSTIHSFKGWESNTVILVLQPEMKENGEYDGYRVQARENTPALIYTALTRARCNLFILNLGNPKYHSFFQKNIEA